jgi:hypothetical protein
MIKSVFVRARQLVMMLLDDQAFGAPTCWRFGPYLLSTNREAGKSADKPAHSKSLDC